MSSAEIVLATRAAAGLFRADGRGLLVVRGGDRVRWLDGMISCDVARLEQEGNGAGSYAALLTNRGKIVADLHVGCLEDAFVLESRRERMGAIREALDRFIIADDVELEDQTDAFECLSLEGPSAPKILGAATGRAESELAAGAENQWIERDIAGVTLRIGRFGASGEAAFQIFVPRGESEAVVAELVKHGSPHGLVQGDGEALEILRVEAGRPQLGAELDEDILPPEARLEHAISVSKGCYVGQEIVARLRSRGQVNHLLVGLRFAKGVGAAGNTTGNTTDTTTGMPALGTDLMVDDRRTGSIKTSAISPTEGPIALAFVRREHAEPGTEVIFEGGAATVAALPFVALPAADGQGLS